MIEIDSLIEMMKNTKNEFWLHSFSQTFFNYLKSVRIPALTISEWHTTLINAAITIDSAVFWELIAKEISSGS